MPFLVGDEKGAVGIDTDPIGRAKTGGNDTCTAAIFAHPQECTVMGDDGSQGMATAFPVIKIARLVRLQTHGELVEVFGHLMVIVEVLIEVDFSVAIEIMKADNL